MNKKIVCLALLLLSTLATFAQTDERTEKVKTFQFRPTVFLATDPHTLSDAFNTHHDDFNFGANYKSFELNLGIGIEVEYRIHKLFGWETGVNYLTQPIKGEKIHSINVPMLLCIHPLHNDRLSMRIGGQVDFLTSNNNDAFRDVACSIPVSIAYNLDIMQFELRYCKGTTDMLRAPYYESIEKDCLMLTAGLIL